MRRRVQVTGMILGLVLFLALGVGAVAAQDEEPGSEETLERADATLERAEFVLDMAQSTAEQTQSIMDFIQTSVTVGGVVVALIGGGLAAVGLGTLTDYRRQVRASAERLEELSVQLESATQAARDIRSTLQAEHAEEMHSIRERAARAVRSLSLLQLGESQRRQGNFDEALATFLEAHRLDPDSQSINYFLGEMYLVARDLDDAIMHLETALEQDPDFAPAIAARGYAIRLQAEATKDAEQRDMLYAEAESLLLRSLKIRPSLRNTEGEAVYGTLGGLYRRQRRLHEAVAAYTRAEEVTPQHSYPAINLAILHTMLGQSAQATAYFERTRELALGKLDDNPYDYWARLDLGFAQLQAGETAAAMETFALAAEHAPARGPLESALNTLGDLNQAPKPAPGVDEAISVLEKALGEK